MRNVTEARKFLRQLVNDGKDVANKGVKDIGGLLTKVIGLIGPGREAVEEIDQIRPELAAASNSDMDNSEASVQGMLNNFDTETQRDLNAIEEAVVAIVRMNARARLEGIEEGRSQAIAEIKAETKAAQGDLSKVRSLQ